MSTEKLPKISVIIPIYKAEKYLRACMDSVLAQTYKNLELLLIDDGSTDNSGSICDEYAKKDHRIRVFHQMNQGVSKTRNYGIQQASGEYILFVDADDLVQPEYIEKLYKTISHGEVYTIALCEIQDLIGENYIPRLEPLSDYQYGGGSLYDQYLEPIITRKIHGSSCRILYPAALLRKYHIEFPCCKIAEDQLFLLEVISHCRCICVCNEFLYLYRQIEHSSSHRAYITDYLSDRMIYLKNLYRIMESSDIDQDQKKWLLSFSFQFCRMILYMNATASDDFQQELSLIDASPFGTYNISKEMEKRFLAHIGRKHLVLNFLVKHRMFTLISLIRNGKRHSL